MFMKKHNLKPWKILIYCNKCKKIYKGWSIADEQWHKLPKDLHKLELCKKCFKKYSNVKHLKYLTLEEILSGKYAYIR